MLPATAPKLHNLYVYTNEECNLACRHCWVTAARRHSVKDPKVSVQQYLDFVDEAIPLGLGFLMISGGEAMLRRDVVLALVEHAWRRGIKTRVETNGTLVDDEAADLFGRAGAQVSMSLDGSNAPLHEAMRMVPGCFDATVAALRRMAQYGSPVEIILSLYRRNLDDIDAMLDLIRSLELPNAWLKLNPVIPSGRGRFMEERGERLTAVELHRFIRDLETRYTDSDVPVYVTAEPAFHSLSYILKGRVQGGHCGFRGLLGLLADGSISFCGMGYQHSEYVFGHVGESDLKELWTSNANLLEVREQVPGHLEGVCANCVLRSTCQGACRSFAFDVYGSITAPSPGCQELYDSGVFPRTRLIDPDLDCSYPAIPVVAEPEPVTRTA